MGSPEQQIRRIELSMEEAKKHVNKRDALLRLNKNADYKAIFLDGFFDAYAKSQVYMKAEPGQQAPEEQAAINKNIDAIGSLRMHLNAIMQLGNQAEHALAQDAETREEILEEQAQMQAEEAEFVEM